MVGLYYIIFMSSPANSVGRLLAKVLRFRVVRTLHSFVRTDLITTISRQRLDQSRWNLQWIFTSPCWWSAWLDSEGQGHNSTLRWRRHPRRRWSKSIF